MNDLRHEALLKLEPAARLLLIDRCVTESLSVDDVVRAGLGRGPWTPEAKALATILAPQVKFAALKDVWPFDCACGAVVMKLDKCHSCGGPICATCLNPRGCPKCVAAQEEKIAQRRKDAREGHE